MYARHFDYTVRRRSIGGHLANIVFRPLIETAICTCTHHNIVMLSSYLLLAVKCTLSGDKTFLAFNNF